MTTKRHDHHGPDQHTRHKPEPSRSEDTPVAGAVEPGETDERFLRLAADFENFKRRKAQELTDRARFASEDAARALLPVLDNLQRAVEHAPRTEADQNFVNGVEMVLREFEAALASLGVTRIAGEGEPFDTAFHEAIGGEESDEVDRETVSAVLQPGYRLHERVIRPALVRVAHPRQPAAAE